MKRQLHFLVATSIIALLCVACNPILEVDINELQENVYAPTVHKKDTLEMTVSLFIDYSTCVREAVSNSAFFATIRPRLTGLKPTMYSIKGNEIKEFSSDMDKINQELNNITEFSYANIQGAVEQICNSNQQAVLITDCEFWTTPEGERTNLPYMKEAFITWLNKGFSIHIITEAYKESYHGSSHDKKRFYLFFTDDKLPNDLYEEISKADDFENINGSYYKLTNSDMKFLRSIDVVDDNLNFQIDTSYHFDYIEIDNSWKDIQKYVMEATDGDGNLIPDGNPIIKGLKFQPFGNYTIEDIDIVASNITAAYLDTVFSDGHSMINIPDGFSLDKDSLKNNTINVNVKENIFDYLNDEFEGNLLRLDFVVKSARNEPISKQDFSWLSISKSGEENISVYESVKQALDNKVTNPIKQNNGIIHTIFIKTEKYK
ncbi:hypothetical protein Barb6_00236 [Bacteroidales bacterium Barb6]|nr:hypothetical protein Barb6_00236 [Bacteroidales bacterium Barb6]